MDYRTKYSMINGGIWLVLFVIFSIIFFSNNYPIVIPISNYKPAIVVILILANISNIFLIFFLKNKEKDDERNSQLMLLSATVTMFVVVGILIACCLALYFIYRDNGSFPISWLWYISFGTLFLTNIVLNLSYVAVSFKGAGYGD